MDPSSSESREFVVGTSGHIDHGKTALVKALTGVDADRFEEEKQRGITIDLGFAPYEDESGTRLGFVDVPGHEKFVHNMLAGVAGFDAVLLVIAADEGVMPQTREHLNICNLLQIPNGLVALTRIDLVEDAEVRILSQHCLSALLEVKVVQNQKKLQDHDPPTCQTLVGSQLCTWCCCCCVQHIGRCCHESLPMDLQSRLCASQHVPEII